MQNHRRLSSALRRRRTSVALLVAVLALSLAAGCGGSALSPQEVQAANRALEGDLQSGAGGTGLGSTGASTAPSGQVPGTTNAPGAAGSSSGTQAGGGTAPASGNGTDAAASGNSAVPAGSGVKAASCAGFKNQTGITNSTISIGNASDISGPVPGYFQATQLATLAYVQYFNATHPNGLCGRKLHLDRYDTRTDGGADQQAYTTMCSTDFAAVGSMSAFDSGGASTAQACGIADLRATAVTGARNRCSTCFSAQATGDHEYENEAFDFYVRHYPTAVKKAALLYLNAGAGVENAMVIKSVAEKRGFTWVYVSAIDVAAFNYAPYVQQLKSKGVEWVTLIGAASYHVRLAQAMQQASYKPQVMAFDTSAYDPVMLSSSATEGAILFVSFGPLEESQPELNLYRQWLRQVAPTAKPTFYGLYAWSASKLFVERALALGGRLSRSSLAASLRSVHAWTAAGLHSPMDVGGKHPPQCLRFLQVKGGKFVPIYGTKYVCSGYSKG